MFSRNIFWCWPYCLLSQCAVTDSIMMLCILFISWLLFNQPVFCGHYQLDQVFSHWSPWETFGLLEHDSSCSMFFLMTNFTVPCGINSTQYFLLVHKMFRLKAKTRPRHSTLKTKKRCLEARRSRPRQDSRVGSLPAESCFCHAEGVWTGLNQHKLSLNQYKPKSSKFNMLCLQWIKYWINATHTSNMHTTYTFQFKPYQKLLYCQWYGVKIITIQ